MDNPLESVVDILSRFNERKVLKELLRTFFKHASGFQQIEYIAGASYRHKDYLLTVEACEKLMECPEIVTLNNETRYSFMTNYSLALSHANYPERAIEVIEELETLVPNDRKRDLLKSYCYFMSYQRDRAEEILRKGLESPHITDETRNEINFNLGTYDLFKGDFRTGMERFLKFGPMFNTWKREDYLYTKWDGQESLQDKVIAVVTEAGIGDEFINFRFAQRLATMARKVYWVTPRQDLVDFYNSQSQITRVESVDDINKAFPHYWCFSMDLPLLLDMTPEDLWHGQYLYHDQQALPMGPSGLFDVIPKDDITRDVNGLKIGLRWQGNRDYDNDLHRTVPYRELLNTVQQALNNDHEGHYTLFSLQRDDGVDAIQKHDPIVDLSSLMDTYAKTFSIINDLDIVITSCTSIAHASAAMGKHTVVMVPIASYYVWCHPTAQSPWYGNNVKIIRQTQPRDWSGPLEQLNRYLKEYFKK